MKLGLLTISLTPSPSGETLGELGLARAQRPKQRDAVAGLGHGRECSGEATRLLRADGLDRRTGSLGPVGRQCHAQTLAEDAEPVSGRSLIPPIPVSSRTQGEGGPMRLLRLIAVLVALGALLTVPQTTSAASNFTAYVACGYRVSKPPATTCPKSGRIGAFFRSNNADVHFRTCVTFPNGQSLCTKKSAANKGQFYVNKLTVGTTGTLKVKWKVVAS